MNVLYEPIAITGCGLISACGASPEDLWQAVQGPPRIPALWTGEKGLPPETLAIRRIENLPQPPAAAVIRRQHRADRLIHLALLAADAAWDTSGLSVFFDPQKHKNLAEHDSSSVAIVAGTSRGPVGKWTEAFARDSRRSGIRPTWAGESSLATLHGSLGALTGATGPSFTISTACSSGGHAIALGASLIATGQVECALVGGADAALDPFVLRQMFSTGILDSAAPQELPCRPFAASASGTMMGEGAAFLVLESGASARARKASVWGMLHGWGMAGDGCSASPESAGAVALEQAVHRALTASALQAQDIAYVNCHGTGTLVNDALESAWLRKLNTLRTHPVRYSSSKAATGHCLGATPVMEAILCLEALRRRELPSTPHTSEPASYAPPGLVLKSGEHMDNGFALSVSLGFWGASSALILGPS